MACGHGCGSTTASARIGSPWNRVFAKGYLLAPLLFNIFFAAVIHVALTRFEVDKDIIDALVNLRRKPGANGRMARDPAPATSLYGMLYADDAAVVSQSPKHPRKIMHVIVIVCEAFDLTVSEDKTEIMCL